MVAIPQMLTQIPKIIAALVGGLAEGISDIAEVGGQIVEGLWQGIQDMGAWIKEKVTGFFSGIVDSVKGLLGIRSPSKVFAGIGGYMAEGLGEGFSEEISDVQKRIDRSMAELAGNASASIDVRGTAAGAPAAASGSYPDDLPGLIAASVREALDGVGVYLSQRKVGELTTDWQRNNARAMGM